MPSATVSENKSKFREVGIPAVGFVPIKCLLAALLILPVPVGAQALQPGAWDVTSTVVDLAVPGVPGFLQRMARGKSKAERKQLSAGQGVEALLVPDPKARCRVDDQRIADGRYSQTLSCPQKKGDAMNIARVGTYDALGFSGRATVRGITAKGPVRIVLDQKARRKP
jgi:hypothetical protein